MGRKKTAAFTWLFTPIQGWAFRTHREIKWNQWRDMEIALTNGLVNLGNRGYNSIYSSYNLTTGGPILLWGVPKFNGKVHRNSIGQIPWKPEKKHLIKEKLLEKPRPGNPVWPFWDGEFTWPEIKGDSSPPTKLGDKKIKAWITLGVLYRLFEAIFSLAGFLGADENEPQLLFQKKKTSFMRKNMFLISQRTME